VSRVVVDKLAIILLRIPRRRRTLEDLMKLGTEVTNDAFLPDTKEIHQVGIGYCIVVGWICEADILLWQLHFEATHALHVGEGGGV
jgi:hypothetical protein